MNNKIEVLFEQFIKFGFVGIITTLISTGINLFFLFLKFNYVVAYTISYAVGIIASYILNSKFVFKESLSFKKFVKFSSVYLVSYLIGLANVMIMVEFFGIKEVLATIVNVCIMTLFNFVFVKLVAFRTKNN